MLTPPPLFSDSKISAFFHRLEATTEPMVKPHEGSAHLQRPAQQRLQHVLTFKSEPNTAGIVSKNDPDKRSPQFPLYSVVAQHVLTSIV